MGKRDAVCCHPGRKQGVVFLVPFKIMIVFVCSVLGPACKACVEARQLYAGSGIKLRPKQTHLGGGGLGLAAPILCT